MKPNLKRLILGIIIFLIGLMATIVGALFKIQHWPYGDTILVLGNLFEVLGLALVILALGKIYRSKN